MPKYLLVLLTLSTILLTAYLTLVVNGTLPKAVSKTEIDTAVNQAKHFYNQKKSRGDDISNGPCLSNALIPNWVADLVHSPRSKDDDLPENQCPAYQEGRAKHFVELDLNGDLIRTQ